MEPRLEGTLLRSRGIPDLIRSACRIYRARGRELYAPAAIVLGAAWIVNMVIRIWWLGGVPLGAFGDPRTPELVRQVATVLAAGVANGMVYALFNSLTAGLLTFMVAEHLRGRPVSSVTALRETGRRLPSVVGATLLFFLAVAGMVVLAGILAGSAGGIALGAAAVAGERLAYLAGAAVGLVVFVGAVPVILYVVLRWALYPQAIVLEGAGPADGLRRSMSLTRDAPGTDLTGRYVVRATCLVLVLLLLQLIVGMVTAVPAYGTSLLARALDQRSEISILNPAGIPLPLLIPLEIFSLLLSAAVIPYGIILFVLLYGDVRYRGQAEAASR